MKINHFVVDTNVMVSALLFKQSIPFRAVKIAEKGTVLYSKSTFIELQKVLNRKKFDKYLSIEERQEFLTEFLNTSQQILIKAEISICRDPKDNKFLELAVNGDAQFIITGDQDLLILNPFREIKIVTPEFLVSQFKFSNGMRI
ncbi:MAG: putative toxin-antitoxin system toxin component, PIN family [Microcystaceae cyanobacterium]